MSARLRHLWNLVLSSYWFVPGLMTLGSIALAIFVLGVDSGLDPEWFRNLGRLSQLFYTGGVDGGRELLSTIAGSMITVAGVVFSITIVALTLASSQFGPRVLANFMRDRANQIVLGTFLSTFLFCLLVLRTIRSEADEVSAVVPHLSITVAIGMSMASIGVLIFFIHHVATAIQAPNIVARIAGELGESIDNFFPEDTGREAPEPPESLLTYAPEAFERESAPVHATRDGYVDVIDMDDLLESASRRKLLYRVEFRPGHFVVRGSVLVRVWPGDQATPEVRHTILDAIAIGPRRTSVQDVEFSINQLVEIAVRALSPSTNDPFTAINCIDRLGAALCHLMRRRLPSPYRADAGGETRLVVSRPFTMEGFVDAAFHQIRQNATLHASVRIRLLETFTSAARCARRPDQLDLLVRHAELELRSAREYVTDASGREAVEQRHRAFVETVARVREELRRERTAG